MEGHSERPKPRDSATLIVVRTPPDRGPLEVLLLERSAKSAFLGGAFVFPGGKLNPADEGARMQALVSPVTQAWCRAQLDPSPGSSLSAARAFGLYVAACRETFEEAGVLFASLRGGGLPAAETLRPWRRRLDDAEVTFAEMLEVLDLTANLDRLYSWAHWITPSAETRRYNTRFLLGHLPDEQTAQIDRREAVSQRWMTPTAALQAHTSGEIFLPPPTERTIQELAPYRAWSELQPIAQARRPPPILPKVHQESGEVQVVLPWDAAYEGLDGEGMAAGDNPRPDLPTRVRIPTTARLSTSEKT